MVKKVFPLLLSYVFLTTQCWAISGGPNYGGGSKVSTVGTYSGVISGDTETDAPGSSTPTIPGDPLPPPSPSGTTTNSNALGLFDLVVPAVGLATGNFLLFADGTVFGGTIDASADPDSATLKGIVQGTYNFNLTTFNAAGNATTTAVTATALGMITAKVRPGNSNSSAAARLSGTANLDINFGEVDPNTLEPIVARAITFTVTGVQQTTIGTGSAAAIGTGSGSGGTSSGG